MQICICVLMYIYIYTYIHLYPHMCLFSCLYLKYVPKSSSLSLSASFASPRLSAGLSLVAVFPDSHTTWVMARGRGRMGRGCGGFHSMQIVGRPVSLTFFSGATQQLLQGPARHIRVVSSTVLSDVHHAVLFFFCVCCATYMAPGY